MLDDISIYSPSTTPLHETNIYFLKDFLIDEQLAHFLHYDVSKLS